jgi:hypothetical protein
VETPVANSCKAFFLRGGGGSTKIWKQEVRYLANLAICRLNSDKLHENILSSQEYYLRNILQ